MYFVHCHYILYTATIPLSFLLVIYTENKFLNPHFFGKNWRPNFFLKFKVPQDDLREASLKTSPNKDMIQDMI